MKSSSAPSTSGHGGGGGKVGMVRKGVERPKPLKAFPTAAGGGNMAITTPEHIQHRDFFVTASGVGVGGPVQVLELYGKVAKELKDKRYGSHVVQQIMSLNKGLKLFGPQLDQTDKEVLDRYQVFLRNACRDGSLDLVARLQLLEIIELRAMKWKANDNVTNYYKTKMLQVEQCNEANFFQQSGPMQYDVQQQHQLQQPLQALVSGGSGSHPTSPLNANAVEFRPPLLPTHQPTLVNTHGVVVNDTARYLASATASLTSILSVNGGGDAFAQTHHPPTPSVPPGQVMVSTGKIDKVPGKQQIREEVVIRNSDSGKVEAGAKDRMVQVIGTDEKTIALAKSLIEDTIQRNASPEPVEVTTAVSPSVTEANNNNWMMQNKASLGTFSYTVEVGKENIKILGANADVVRAAKIALDEHFATNPESGPNIKAVESLGANTSFDSTDAVCQTDKVTITYDRRRLLAYSASPLCRQPPTNWSEHWLNGLRKELGRNLNPKPAPNLETDQKVEGAPLHSDYFVPSPEKFMSANAKFPQGFVRLPMHHRRASTGNGGGGDGQDGASHLDQLFTGASAYHAGYRRPQKTKTEIERLLAQCGSTWDQAKGQYVSPAQLVAQNNTRK